MKNSSRYSRLWREKRNELKVAADKEQDWAAMNNLLDKHLPVSPGGNLPGDASGLVKFGGMMLLLSAIIAIAIYVSGYFDENSVDKPRRDTNVVRQQTGSNDRKYPSISRDGRDTSVNQGAGIDTAPGTVKPVYTAAEKRTRSAVRSPSTLKTGRGYTGRTNTIVGLLPAYRVKQPGARPLNISGSAPGNLQPGAAKDIAPVNRSFRLQQDTVNTGGPAVRLPSPPLPSPAVDAGMHDTIKTNNASIRGQDSTNANLPSQTAGKTDKKPKARRARSDSASKFDIGVLAGTNASNHLDVYGGVYGTYHMSAKWGFNAQVWVFNGQDISGDYGHANGSRVDSGRTIRVTDSRKAYFITVPLRATYNFSERISVKAGPVVNIPLKQTNGVTTLTPATINRDTVYFNNTMALLNATKYDQKINLGLSGGVIYQFKRFNVEAAYLKNISGFNVLSGYGNYKMAGPGSWHLIMGIRLNKAKK